MDISTQEQTSNASNSYDKPLMADSTQTEHIEKIIKLIISCNLHPYEKEKLFRMKFPNFAKTMPYLFEKLVKNEMKKEDFEQMEMMLDMRKKLIDKKEIEVLDADKIVYGDLRKKMLEPKLNFDKKKLDEYMNKKEYTEDELNCQNIKFDVKE